LRYLVLVAMLDSSNDRFPALTALAATLKDSSTDTAIGTCVVEVWTLS
jgi:hypothetical protein